MSSAPLDGTPVRLFVFAGSFIASFLQRRTLPGNVWGWGLSGGWYLLDDDAIELDDPLGWQPLTDACARFENETGLVTLEPVLP
jgi:hypothetical protein